MTNCLQAMRLPTADSCGHQCRSASSEPVMIFDGADRDRRCLKALRECGFLFVDTSTNARAAGASCATAAIA